MKKLLSIVLSLLMVISILPFGAVKVSASESRYSNFYAFTKTGDSAKDVVAAAMAQNERTESSLGYTIDAGAWCADFVCDAAAFAGVSSSIVPYTYSGRGNPNALLNYMLTNCGATQVTTPQAGDFIFYYCTKSNNYCHVGIMTDATNSVHGNLYVNGASRVFYMPYTYFVDDQAVNSQKCYTVKFIRPNYSNQTCRHAYSDATCTKPKTCKNCGVTSGSALGHIYSNSSDTDCNRCGAKRATIQRTNCDFRVTIPANYKLTLYDTETATTASSRWLSAQSSSYTLYCNQKIVLTNGQIRYRFVSGDNYTLYFIYDTSKMSETVKHNCKAVSTVKAADCKHIGYDQMKCTTCGSEIKKPNWIKGPHSYTNKCDTSCNLCGEKRSITHSYITVVTKATITKNGKTQQKCYVCGNIKSSKTIYEIASISFKKAITTYDGSVKKPAVVIKDTKGNTISASNYTVIYPSDMKDVGVYRVKVALKGNYSGGKSLTYTITPAKASSCTVKLSKTSYTYDGKAKKPTVTVKDSKGKTVSSKYYTVSYASGRKNVGKYKVTIKFKGNYSGTETLYFTINPAKTTLKSVSGATKSIKVSVNKKTTQVSGYEIQYSTSKKFTSAKTKIITSAKTTSATIKKLKTKTTYYVRVRTYKTVSGKKYYSGWSNYKSAKTK